MTDDFMEYWFNKYKADPENKEPTGKAEKADYKLKLAYLKEFIGFVRRGLTSNPPVALDARTPGMGLILRDNTRINFLPNQTEEDNYQTYEREIPVTRVSRQHEPEVASHYIKV